jgi:transposase
VALGARTVLGAAAGRSNNSLAAEPGITRPTILLWRERFAEAGVDGLLEDTPQPGRKERISAAKAETIVNVVLHDEPADATRWSRRTSAKARGVSSATVQRIWSARGLQPHRVETFKPSRDPEFVRNEVPAQDQPLQGSVRDRTLARNRVDFTVGRRCTPQGAVGCQSNAESGHRGFLN